MEKMLHLIEQRQNYDFFAEFWSKIIFLEMVR